MNKIIMLLTIIFECVFINIAYAEVFPTSTEIQIGKIFNIINNAPNGSYLTVGGERAFRGGSMFEGIEYLVIIDVAPEIIRFNKINIELLRAKNKEIYKDLRWYAKFEDWQKISRNLSLEDFAWWKIHVRDVSVDAELEELNKYGYIIYNNKYLNIKNKLISFYPKLATKFNNVEKTFLQEVSSEDLELSDIGVQSSISKEEFSWYIKERQNKQSCVNLLIKEPAMALDLGKVLDYKSGNYLFHDDLYNRLHNLVNNNKIIVLELDLKNKSHINALIENIKKMKTKVAILDLDNLYEHYYMGEEKFHFALNRLLTLGSKDSILVLMYNYKEFACVEFSIYLGFTFENINHWPNKVFFDKFISNLPPDLYPLIDGRLYSGKDSLPI